MSGRLIGRLAGLLVLVAAIGWFFTLRPEVLGGPATYLLVTGTSMEPTIHEGSLVVAFRQPAYRRGEVVVFRIPTGQAGAGHNVIHRIVGGFADRGFVMRGDNTNASDLWRPTARDILGRAQLVIPGAEGALLVARSPIVAASVAAALAAYLALGLWAPTEVRARRARGNQRRTEAPVRAQEGAQATNR